MSGSEKQSFVIIGSINQDDKVSVSESYLAPPKMPSSEYPKESEYTIAFLDNTGATLDEKPFTVSFESPDLPLPLLSTSFSVICPFPNEAESVELRHSEKVLLRLEKSDSAPTISNVRIIKAEDSESDIIIEWQASDPDGDDLTYSVSYSIDQGKSFIPIEGGIRRTKLTLSTLGFGGSESALIKVTASDGFYTSEAAISKPFFLPTKPPVATILWPKSEDDNFGSDEVLVLQGIGLDPQDGILKGENLEWFLKDLEGEKTLGKGEEITIKKPLPAGKHTIRLVATDKEGKSGDDERVIVIRHENP